MASITIPAPFDAHVHLRQVNGLAELVAPHVALGGVRTAYIMPNTVPPITNTEMALRYQAELQKLAPETELLMTLYLSPSLTPDEVRKAAKAGVKGVKSYPRGVTTNSAEGVESYDVYFPVFAAMQEEGLVLNLHGEVPSNPHNGVCVLNAEATFLPQLKKIHSAFPSLRIVLEHATTSAAVEAVKACGPTVGCTITAHHLSLTVDDWAGNGLHFCKPVAKLPADREALRAVIRSGHPRFFLGSDSAPHPTTAKLPTLAYNIDDVDRAAGDAAACCAAGVYTSARLLPTLAAIFESALPPSDDSKASEAFSPIPLERLPDFASRNGRRFYGLEEPTGAEVRLEKRAAKVEMGYRKEGTQVLVVPFWAGKRIGWEIV